MTRAEAIDKAQRAGIAAAKAGKSQNDNPHNPKRPGERYDVELAVAWNHAFCEEAYGITVFD